MKRSLAPLLALPAAIPLWIVPFPAIQDLPNHLGRVHVLLDLLAGGSAFGKEYAATLLPLPNLAADLVLLPLVALFPAAIAGKLFLTGVMLLTAYAGFRFLAAAGTPHAGWLALVLVWNWFMHVGFLSFVLSVPLALLAAAYRMEREDRWGNRERVVFALLATATYFAHLSSFAFLVAFVQLRKARRGRPVDLFRLEPGILPGMLCWLALAFGERGGVGWIGWEDLPWRAWTIANLFRVHYLVGDLIVFAAVVAGGVWATRSIRRRALAPLGLLLLLFLLLPRSALGGYWVEARILPFLAYFLLAALEVEPRRARIAGVAGLLLVTLWTGYGAIRVGGDVSRMVRAADAIPRGSRVLPLTEKAEPGEVEIYHHVVTWLVSRRDAVTPHLFAKPYQHPVRAIFDRTSPHEYWFDDRGAPPDVARLAMEWDFAWCTARGPIEEELLRHGTLFLEAGDLRVYRLAR